MILTNKTIETTTDSGAVLVFVAMLLTALIVIAGLAIDTAYLAASKEEANNAAKSAALRAIEDFTRQEETTIDNKFQSAIEVANTVLADNKVLGNREVGARPLSVTESADGLKIIHGRYYSEMPLKCDGQADQTVCGQDKELPCFVESAAVNRSCDSVPDVESNAVRIAGPLYTAERLFGGVVGMSTINIEVDEVAAIVPRHTCFLVDISSSSAYDTHQASAANPYKSRMALYLRKYNPLKPLVAGDDHEAIAIEMAANRLNRASPTFSAPSVSDPNYRRVHFASDYLPVAAVLSTDPLLAEPYLAVPLIDSEYTTSADAADYQKYHRNPADASTGINYSVGNDEQKYIVDHFRNGTHYQGPEPLRTILEGMNTAMDMFKERAVTGDMACVIFYDNQLKWSRIINLTSDFDYIKKFTDVESGLDGPVYERLLKHGIFPQYNTFSNATAAVNEALNQFAAVDDSTVPAVNQIVFIGDGLSVCTENGVGVATNKCSNRYLYYKQAMVELSKTVSDHLVPQKISFNVILAGDYIQPNYLARPSVENSGSCMSDTEAREDMTDFVDGGDSSTSDAAWTLKFDSMSAASPFVKPNADYYRLTRITGGVWGPLLKYTPGVGCTPNCSGSDPVPVTTSCSSPSEQMEKYMEQVMGTHPFMIAPH